MMEENFERAYALNKEINDRVSKEAAALGYDERRLLFLWNQVVRITADTFGEKRGLIYSWGKQTYSLKGFNIVYDLKRLIGMAVETLLTFESPETNRKRIKNILYLVYKVVLLCNIEISDVHAQLLEYCHKRNAYQRPITEEELLLNVPEACANDVTLLSQMGCIDIIEGQVWMKEKVIIRTIK